MFCNILGYICYPKGNLVDQRDISQIWLGFLGTLFFFFWHYFYLAQNDNLLLVLSLWDIHCVLYNSVSEVKGKECSDYFRSPLWLQLTRMANLLQPNIALDLKASFFKDLLAERKGFFLKGHLQSLKRKGLHINSLNN